MCKYLGHAAALAVEQKLRKSVGAGLGAEVGIGNDGDADTSPRMREVSATVISRRVHRLVDDISALLRETDHVSSLRAVDRGGSSSRLWLIATR